MRNDALGLFWEDRPVVKEVKEKIKRTPPKPVWLSPDYLPGLSDAKAFNVDYFTDHELIQASQSWIDTGKRERMVFDVECYPNFFQVAFKSLRTGKVIDFIMTETLQLNIPKLRWMFENFTVVSFNGISYDLPIVSLALAGKNNALLMHATEQIIVQEMRPGDVLRQYKTKNIARDLNVDHIDLIEVAPLSASLKIYSGRLHTRKMQDLPFPPGTVLSEDQQAIVRFYCVNDLESTELLYNCISGEIKLREGLTLEYGIDLRSKSDAQIAEAIIAAELEKITGDRVTKPTIQPGTCYKYQVPHFIRYNTELMNWTLNLVRNANFVVGLDGAIAMPAELNDLEINIAGGVYRMGIGGLHSSEKSTGHVADDEYMLIDRDVVSYYPRIILNLGLYPKHLGPAFLRVYGSLVQRRLDAKARGDKIGADSLKITINGSFGKLGSKWSILYAPDLLIQTTITGQLSLLMLIERLELLGIHVVSANTDGIVIKCKRTRKDELDAVIKQWEKDTGFETEEARYKCLFSRDVNNYIAVKEDGTTKNKGAYANPWADPKNMAGRLHKNPANLVCTDAVEAFLTKGTPIAETIQNCKDISKFVSVRSVKGGGVKVWDMDKDPRTEYLGKSIRWYYGEGVTGEIVYASSGNKVPRTDGAVPLMQLPEQFPSNVDYNWYIEEATSILQQIGYM